jgi:hypothetical protein
VGVGGTGLLVDGVFLQPPNGRSAEAAAGFMALLGFASCKQFDHFSSSAPGQESESWGGRFLRSLWFSNLGPAGQVQPREALDDLFAIERMRYMARSGGFRMRFLCCPTGQE